MLRERSKKHGIVDRRAYSISSSKDDKALELLIRLTGSDYLNDVRKLKEGDVVEIIGPMGSTFVPSDSGAIFVAGGTGISPFLSILRSKSKNKFSLYGFESSERPLYAKDELIKIAKSEGYIVKFFSGPATQEHLCRISTETDDRTIFISGPQLFVNGVFNKLLHLGIKEERMYFEACYPEDSQIDSIKEIFKKSDLEKSIEKKYPTTSLGNIFFQIAYQTSNHVIFTDRNGVILYANNAARDITGYTLHEMFGQTPRLWGGLMPSENYNRVLWNNLKEGVSFKRTLLNRRKDGRLYVALASISPIYEDKNIIGYMATEEDITEIENIDKAKSEFIALASHQLKTPPTAIKLLTERLLGGKMGIFTEKQKEYLDDIQSSNQRMIDLVNALLNVSHIEMGVFTIQVKENDPCIVVQNIVDELKPVIDKKQLKLKTISLEKNIILMIDEPLFRMVINNLVINAVHYTAEGGEIQVECKVVNKGQALGEKLQKENCFVVVVSDTGYGIPQGQQSKIFTKLFRADNAREKHTDGTGLGLYIVKSILDHSGGLIWFTSRENEGSVFYVAIPMTGMKAKAGEKELVV